MGNNLFRKHIFVSALFLFLSGIVLVFLFYDLWTKVRFYQEINSIESEVEISNISIITIKELEKNRDQYFVVDVREIEEFEQGRIEGAKNIRLGDILNDESVRSKTIQNSEGKSIVFFCHDGERSKLAAELFQNYKGISVFVVEDAFKQLRSSSDIASEIWTGTLDRVLPDGFWDRLQNKGYKIKEIGTDFVVDVSLEKNVIDSENEGKIILHAPIMKMSSSEVEVVLQRIGEQTISVVCDSKVSCFYAKVLAYRVEEQGGEFVGYYFWEKDD